MTGPGIPRIERRGPFAAIRFDNPPVNALNNVIRVALIDMVDALLADPAVEGILFVAAGSTFVAGADLRELRGGTRPLFIGDMLRRIELSPKPVVAAMRGPAMGGGLEIALACTARIAGPGARFALPELRMALIPGAGGTQRLPRLIGAGPALDMMLSGRAIAADEAMKLGLIDEIAEDPEKRGWELLATRPARRPAQEIDPTALSAGAARIATDPALAARPAAAMLIEAMTAISESDPDAGYADERALFLACLATPEARQRIDKALERLSSEPG